MAFIALGINHKTASVEVRERVAFTPEQLVEALQQLCRLTPSREAAILSTCNRSELYLEQDQLSSDEVLQWLADYHRLSQKIKWIMFAGILSMIFFKWYL